MTGWAPSSAPGELAFVAVDIALLFGLYGAACPVRLAAKRGAGSGWLWLPGEFTMPVAAWYARRMGLPTGDVICVCNENSAPWELLHRESCA